MKTGLIGLSGDFLGVGVGLASGVGTGGSGAAFLARLPDCANAVRAETIHKAEIIAIATGNGDRDRSSLFFIGSR